MYDTILHEAPQGTSLCVAFLNAKKQNIGISPFHFPTQKKEKQYLIHTNLSH